MPMRPWIKRLWLPAGVVILGLLAGFASSRPDGLEWAMEVLGIVPASGTTIAAPLADYTWPGRLPGWGHSLLSALAGGAVVGGLLWLIRRWSQMGGHR